MTSPCWDRKWTSSFFGSIFQPAMLDSRSVENAMSQWRCTWTSGPGLVIPRGPGWKLTRGAAGCFCYGWMSHWKLGSKVRISGLFHPNIPHLQVGEITIDPNHWSYLPGTSKYKLPLLVKKISLAKKNPPKKTTKGGNYVRTWQSRDQTPLKDQLIVFCFLEQV